MSARLAALSAFALISAAPAAAPAQPAAAPVNMAGTWDLTWQTRRGPERSGHLVVTQSGTRLTAQIHGKGSVKTKGELAGHDFTLRGSRMAIPYVIAGRVE